MKKRVEGSKKADKEYSKEEHTSDSKSVTSLGDIAKALEHMRFRKAFRGVSEEDVWRKIKELDEMYRKIYDLQEQKYRTLLDVRRRLHVENQKTTAGPGRESNVYHQTSGRRRKANVPEGEDGGLRYE